MTVTDFLLPVFVLILLTFVLHAFMGWGRVSSLTRGEVKAEDVNLRQPNWPPRVTQWGNAYHNQLELPLLFYILIAFILITRVGDIVLLALAWAFVLCRLVHAYIHTTSNDLGYRFRVYGVGLIVLAIMWVIFAIKILTGT